MQGVSLFRALLVSSAIACMLFSGCATIRGKDVDVRGGTRCELLVGPFVCKNCGARKTVRIVREAHADASAAGLPDVEVFLRSKGFAVKAANHEADQSGSDGEVWHRFDFIPGSFKACSHVWNLSKKHPVEASFRNLPPEPATAHLKARVLEELYRVMEEEESKD